MRAQEAAAQTTIINSLLIFAGIIVYVCITSSRPLINGHPYPDPNASFNPLRNGANQFPMFIPFRDGILFPKLGPSFYLVLAAGIVNLFLGILMYPNKWFDNRFLKAEDDVEEEMVRKWEERRKAAQDARKEIASSEFLKEKETDLLMDEKGDANMKTVQL
jgi:hypothetical protein